MAEDTNVPETNLEGVEGTGAEVVKKEKVLIPDIIRGRMPIVIVFMIRYGDQKEGATKALATLFGTTVGKITDIKKGSTFKYLTDAFKPTATQKADGIEYLKKHVGYDKGEVDKVINELEQTVEATIEEAAAIEATRAVAKGQTTKKKDGEPAAAGGGNRTKAKKEKAEPKDPPSGDDLLG